MAPCPPGRYAVLLLDLRKCAPPQPDLPPDVFRAKKQLLHEQEGGWAWCEGKGGGSAAAGGHAAPGPPVLLRQSFLASSANEQRAKQKTPQRRRLPDDGQPRCRAASYLPSALV